MKNLAFKLLHALDLGNMRTIVSARRHDDLVEIFRLRALDVYHPSIALVIATHFLYRYAQAKLIAKVEVVYIRLDILLHFGGRAMTGRGVWVREVCEGGLQ